MKTLKKLLFAALATIGIMFASQAEPVLGEKTPISGGWTRTIADENGTAIVNVYTNTATSGYSFEVPERVTEIDYLIVGGGGSGAGGTGYKYGGGGGAGGVLTNIVPFAVAPKATLIIKVGKGGVSAATGRVGVNGSPSSITADAFTLEALGGGGGGGNKSYVAKDGGCGGGGGGTGGSPAGKAIEDANGNLQGFDGGATTSTSGERAGSGGGGAGDKGGNGGSTSSTTGVGGKGILCDITGESLWYAGGGGGGSSSQAVAGGLGGGGNGGYGSSTLAKSKGVPGEPGTGGGGGGGGAYQNSGPTGAQGGSGVVAIRYMSKVESQFVWDQSKCNVFAYRGDVDITTAGFVNSNALVTVTSIPNPTFGYASIPDGWAEGEDGTITKTFSASEDFVLSVPDPEKTGGGELVSVDLVEAQNATKLATVGGEPLTVTMVEKDTEIVVVAIPNAYYEYAVIPDDWSAGEEGTITRTYVAASDTTITIPEPAPIMVQINVQGLENTTFVIKTNEEEIANGSYVQEGTAVTVVVTPQGIYEYSAAPEGWTKNADGTIVCERVAESGMDMIVVPSEKFRKQQVALSFVVNGVSYVATNIIDDAEVKTGSKVDVDAQIAIVAKPYSEVYVFGDVLPEGWSHTEDGAIAGTFAAAATITIPTAAWAPTDGELIENGGFEFFDRDTGYTPAYGFPTSMLNWKGDGTLESQGYRGYGLWKKGDKGKDSRATAEGSAHGGTYAGCAFSRDGLKDEVLTASFTTPENSKAKSEYQLEYWTKRFMTDKGQSLAVSVLKGSSTVTNLVVETPTTSWRKDTHVVTGLEPNTAYKIKFALTANNTSFAIDDVSLKMVQKKGLAIMLY